MPRPPLERLVFRCSGSCGPLQKCSIVLDSFGSIRDTFGVCSREFAGIGTYKNRTVRYRASIGTRYGYR
eukprot:scaffold151186_cov33-Prasinocladus_malaysianus.AAC.1